MLCSFSLGECKALQQHSKSIDYQSAKGTYDSFVPTKGANEWSFLFLKVINDLTSDSLKISVLSSILF